MIPKKPKCNMLIEHIIICFTEGEMDLDYNCCPK